MKAITEKLCGTELSKDRETALWRAREWQELWEKRFPELGEWLEETIEWTLGVFAVGTDCSTIPLCLCLLSA